MRLGSLIVDKSVVRSSQLSTFLTMLALVTQATLASSSAYRAVALTGEQVPGAASGVVYSSFETPVLDGMGRTAFRATLAGPGVTVNNNNGLYSESSGTLTQIARASQQAPGLDSGVLFRGFGDPYLNRAGQAAFAAGLSGPNIDTANDSGIYRASGSTLNLVVQNGQQAHDANPGVTYNGLTLLGHNEAGQIIFRTGLNNPASPYTIKTSIYSDGSGALLQAAWKGQSTNGVDNLSFSSFFSEPVMNGTGQAVFGAKLIGSGLTWRNDAGIYKQNGAGFVQVAREGEQVPGAAPGAVFSSLNTPVLNNAGQIAFSTMLTGTDVDASNNNGVYCERGGTLVEVARTGQQAPGADPGVAFRGMGSVVINHSGRTAFVATLTGTGVDTGNDTGIYSEGHGSLIQLARTGDQVPGSDPGVLFSGFAYSVPAMNAMGQTVIWAQIDDPNADQYYNTGIYATDPSGQLTQIARTGDEFDVNEDPLIEDMRTISHLSLINAIGNITYRSGNEDGRRSAFNDLGQVAFQALFTDGSQGIIVSDLVAVPEPNCLLLMALLTIRMSHRRA